jgi:CO dehydrogenase/acetyl-CoA synthase alpha subunit
MRKACQICGWSSPRGADVIIGVMGVDVENFILLIARDEFADAHEHLERLASRLASEYQLSHRETILGALAEKREGVRTKMIENFQDQCPFNDLGCVLSIFANCTLCGECLKVCPIFEFGETGPLQNASLVEELILISRWLASCTGCGMCEQKCKQEIPLSLLVNSLSHRICQELQYLPGEINQKIPWV